MFHFLVLSAQETHLKYFFDNVFDFKGDLAAYVTVLYMSDNKLFQYNWQIARLAQISLSSRVLFHHE